MYLLLHEDLFPIIETGTGPEISGSISLFPARVSVVVLLSHSHMGQVIETT